MNQSKNIKKRGTWSEYLENIEKEWDMNFMKLKKFKKEHGHCEVPYNPANKALYRLSIWCVTQRQRRKFHPLKYNPDRIRKLDSIGFSWNSLDARFERKFKELMEFKKKFGHCDVPFNGKNYRSLGMWVHHQRTRHNDPAIFYPPEREKRLNEAGFSWVIIDNSFEEKFQLLSDFKKKHGHCDVPIKNKVLIKWCYHLRESKKMNKLSSGRIKRLNDLGFKWNPNEDRFETNLKELTNYFKLHGHIRVTIKENPKMQAWCVKLRSLRKHPDKIGTLTTEQIERLNAIKFEWNPSTKRRYETSKDAETSSA